MAFAGFPHTGAGLPGIATPPDSVAQEVSLDRTGDPLARQIFETLAYEPVSEQVTREEWARITTGLTSNSAKKRDRATAAMERITQGPRRMARVGAVDACCLILFTQGLTLEQIGLAFGLCKGHIARKIETASQHYAQAAGVDPHPLSNAVFPDINRAEKRNLSKWAARVYRKLVLLSIPARAFFVARLNYQLRRLRRIV